MSENLTFFARDRCNAGDPLSTFPTSCLVFGVFTLIGLLSAVICRCFCRDLEGRSFALSGEPLPTSVVVSDVETSQRTSLSTPGDDPTLGCVPETIPAFGLCLVTVTDGSGDDRFGKDEVNR